MSDEWQLRKDIDRFRTFLDDLENTLTERFGEGYSTLMDVFQNYYDISQIQALLQGKSDTDHTHTSSDVTDLLDVIYPVGHIYMSITNSHPNIGTWVQIKDTFLLACGDTYNSDGDVDTAQHGEATHTLTESEMPSHSHRLNGWEVIISQNGNTGNAGLSSGTLVHPEREDNQARYTQNTGGSNGTTQPHNNMPPYMAVYVYKRTA